MRFRRGTLGFTLIELMIALALAAMLLALGIPRFIEILRNSEIRSTTESMVNGLRTARIEATRRNAQVAFTLISGGPSWAVNQFNPVTGTLIQPPIQQYAKLEAGPNSQVAMTPANAVSIVFNGLGHVISPSPLATPNIQQMNIGSVVTGQARTLRIYVDDTRGVRMCDPDPALALLSPPDARAC